ncbi:MAG: hypothetical protein J6N53_08115 [Lachnospiraceae bacterium]|nr:hypothetical protein [Lachnospiraceae bacterium]MBP3294981.1 hypothetical protein [Lachnospiraceae bacterium]
MGMVITMKAVILTSDQHPIHMKMLDERFISRFKQGTIIDIKKQ